MCNIDYLKCTYLFDLESDLLNMSDTVSRRKVFNKLRGFASMFFAEVYFGINSKNSTYSCHEMKIKISKMLSHDLKNLLITFAHELAHHIQYLILYDSNKDFYELKVFDDFLMLEKCAERLAYFICKKYFSNMIKFKHQWFNQYRSKTDVENLKRYFYSCEENCKEII